MKEERVPVIFRLPPDQRRRLREILLRGDVSMQDFFGACVRVALGEKDPVSGTAALDPLGAVAMLRNQSPRPSYAKVARSALGLESPRVEG